ncbi:MAG: glutathione peroxidase [Candidatus Caenarcaniphilales bacterium]|nr:glutathione peroxidase [Candidatus Caenarcaniphilales bacterium]
MINYSSAFFILTLLFALSWLNCNTLQAKVLSSSCPQLLQKTVKDIEGVETDLCSYKGKVLLIVNTASKCGFTSQYAELETLYKRYKSKGFIVLAFPSGDFLGQEFHKNEEVQNFCSKNFQITFPIFEKSHVKGAKQSELFKSLSLKQGSPKWNFQKYLVDREGKVIKKFAPWVKPTNKSITKAIEKELAVL